MDGSAGQEPDCPWRLGISVGLCTLLLLSRALIVNERRQIPFHSNLEGSFSIISLFDSLPSRKTYQIRDPCSVGDSRVCLQACLPLAKCVGKPGCGARVSVHISVYAACSRVGTESLDMSLHMSLSPGSRTEGPGIRRSGIRTHHSCGIWGSAISLSLQVSSPVTWKQDQALHINCCKD